MSTYYSSIDAGSQNTLFKDNFGGHAGFEELKKYIRHGNEFCKEVAFLMQERADVEMAYSKGLSRVAAKLLKLTQAGIGSLTDGWRSVSSGMEQEADLHKNLGNALLEDIAKPLKHLADAQHKAKKPIELVVDRSLKSLTDKRTEEIKAKKATYDHAKSHEKAEEAKPGKSKTEKDINKTEKKQKQIFDALRKSDRHYCESCEKAEVARQEWDFAVNKFSAQMQVLEEEGLAKMSEFFSICANKKGLQISSAQMQVLEEERLAKMSEFLNQYDSHLSVLGPKLTQCCEKLHGSVLAVDIAGDISSVAKQKGSGPCNAEQILIDSYAEDKQFTMKTERRKLALQNYLLHLRTSIQREEKGREGVEKLLEVYRGTPNFADKEGMEEAKQRYNQVIFMTNFLEANHYKMASYLAELEGSNKPSHKFAKYIETSRDKQISCFSSVESCQVIYLWKHLERMFPMICHMTGLDKNRTDVPNSRIHGMLVSLLKLPMNMSTEGHTGYDVTNVTIGALACGDIEAFDDDEFDDDPSPEPHTHRVVGRCRALYDYTAAQGDELNLTTGNIINIYDKQPDGWWQGELHGRVGLFPETYVQEI